MNTLKKDDTNETTSLLDLDALDAYIEEKKLPQYRKKQVLHAVFQEHCVDIDEITTLPKDLRNDLKQHFHISNFSVKDTVESSESTKFLFEMPDGTMIETVLMYHRHEKPTAKHSDRKILRSRTKPTISNETHILNRITICISSQVWCAVWCVFCVTGKLGFKKNLSAEEILMQIHHANNYVAKKFWKKEDWTRRKVRNVVFMGMGEPMLNYKNMKHSIQTMLDQKAFNLSKRHITISTSGVATAIKKIVDDKIDVRLALSLHAPNQKLREELIPMIGKRRPLDELMETIDYYVAHTGNKIFYEYIMIKGKTDTPKIAHQLGKLLAERDAHVNLIPYNENPAVPELVTSEYDTIIQFKNILQQYPITVTVRDTLWRDVKWACWQLGYETVVKNQQIKSTQQPENEYE